MSQSDLSSLPVRKVRLCGRKGEWLQLLFLVAGYDTTSNALSYAAYELAVNPQVQERLYQEIEQVCGTDPSSHITYDQLSKLKYTDAVIKETLRLYPLASL